MAAEEVGEHKETVDAVGRGDEAVMGVGIVAETRPVDGAADEAEAGVISRSFEVDNGRELGVGTGMSGLQADGEGDAAGELVSGAGLADTALEVGRGVGTEDTPVRG